MRPGPFLRVPRDAPADDVLAPGRMGLPGYGSNWKRLWRWYMWRPSTVRLKTYACGFPKPRREN